MWLKNGCKYSSLSKVENISEFSKSWWAWWKDLQPEWHSMSDGSLSQHLPDHDEKWVHICKGGANGFVMLILTLAWWLVALDGNIEEDNFSIALQDFGWVLDCVLTFKQSLKRPLDGPDSGNHNKKRYVKICLHHGFTCSND
jgi:hypothetical protein